MVNFEIPYQHARNAEEVSRKSRSSFALSFSFLTPQRRAALNTVYAFFRIVDDCVDEVRDIENQKLALNFWKQELTMVYHGKPDHPIMRELQRVVKQYAIPESYLLGLVQGCEMDIYKNRYDTLAHLENYCYHVASLVGLTCMQIFEHASPTARKSAVDLGLAFQLTNILRDVGTDLKSDRIYLPRDVMKRFGYSEANLAAGIEDDAFLKIMNFFYDRAEAYYDLAWPEFATDTSGKLLATRAMAEVYRAVLHKIKRENFPVLHKKVQLNSLQKTKILFPLVLKSTCKKGRAV